MKGIRMNKENVKDTAETVKIIEREDSGRTIDRETYSDINS